MPHPRFSDDEIQQRAYHLYQARGAAPGDPYADWQEAIRQLEQERSILKGRRLAFSVLSRRLTSIEKKAIEPTANWLEQADIFRIVEKVSPIIEAIGVIAIPMAIWWFSETSQEAKEQQEKAVRAQAAVQNYLNQLSDTLSTGKLESDKTLQTIVRASTLALLDNPDLQPDPDLDEEENRRNDRKGQTISYLLETGLIRVKVPEQAQNSNQAEEQKEVVISLANANLRSADLNRAYLFSADLRSADLNRAYLFSADLRSADLRSADLSGADLGGANLRSANLRGADLRSANLFNVDLFSADLKSAYLSRANLSITDLSGANLSGADLSSADLSDAYLRSADLSGADLSRINLRSANLSRINLRSANLRSANLRSANLSRANLSGAYLNRANLSGVDLSRANLSRANLSRANLSRANLSRAKGWAEEQLMQAKLCNTELPPDTNLNPDRDCEELGLSAN